MAGPAPTVLSVYHTGTASMASAASPGSATANLDTTVWNVTTQKLSVSNNHGRGVNLPISKFAIFGVFSGVGFHFKLVEVESLAMYVVLEFQSHWLVQKTRTNCFFWFTWLHNLVPRILFVELNSVEPFYSPQELFTQLIIFGGLGLALKQQAMRALLEMACLLIEWSVPEGSRYDIEDLHNSGPIFNLMCNFFAQIPILKKII